MASHLAAMNKFSLVRKGLSPWDLWPFDKLRHTWGFLKIRDALLLVLIMSIIHLGLYWGPPI